jgi:hypothetical protein
MDGRSGLPLPSVARNAMGLALAAEKHGSMFLRKGAQLAGVLSTSAKLAPADRKANEDAWRRAYGGTDNSGRTAMLDGDLKYTPISSTNKDSQWLEARTFQVEELLRFIGVPGVLCGYADKTSTYASAEQFFLSFVTHTVRPETETIAQELNFSVVTGSPEYFADFILEGLLKGDIKTRYSAHQLAIASGWKSRNEVRIEEDYNRGPAALDEFLEPMNMAEAGTQDSQGGAAPPASRRPASGADPAESDPAAAARLARLSAIATRSVERLVRKEMHAIAGTSGRIGAAKRFAGDPEGWASWLAQFYTEHATAVAEDLGISVEAAQDYCDAQAGSLGRGLAGATLAADFHSTSTRALLALLED